MGFLWYLYLRSFVHGPVALARNDTVADWLDHGFADVHPADANRRSGSATAVFQSQEVLGDGTKLLFADVRPDGGSGGVLADTPPGATTIGVRDNPDSRQHRIPVTSTCGAGLADRNHPRTGVECFLEPDDFARHGGGRCGRFPDGLGGRSPRPRQPNDVCVDSGGWHGFRGVVYPRQHEGSRSRS